MLSSEDYSLFGYSRSTDDYENVQNGFGQPYYNSIRSILGMLQGHAVLYPPFTQGCSNVPTCSSPSSSEHLSEYSIGSNVVTPTLKTSERSPRPILRRFEPDDPRPLNVGRPSSPPTSEAFVSRHSVALSQDISSARRYDQYCVFCRKSGASSKMYKNHAFKDMRGIVVCPVMRAYSCPKCQNSGGDNAHTVHYCPIARAATLDKIVQAGIRRRQTESEKLRNQPKSATSSSISGSF